MIVKLLGIAVVDFVSKDGQPVKGKNLFVSYPDERVTGEKCEKFFVGQRIALPPRLELGSEISLSFNRYGKIESVRINDDIEF